MKLLNIDELAKIDREVVINGKTYPIAERSVESMINAVRLDKQVNESKDPEIFFEAMVDAVASVVPKCPRNVIASKSMRQLTAILEFANASDEEAVANSSAADEQPVKDDSTGE